MTFGDDCKDCRYKRSQHRIRLQARGLHPGTIENSQSDESSGLEKRYVTGSDLPLYDQHSREAAHLR